MGQPTIEEIDFLIDPGIENAEAESLLVRIDDFDYFNGIPASQNAIKKQFQLNDNTTLFIEPSTLPGRTHRITLSSELMPQNGLYSLAFPYLDYSKRTAFLEEIKRKEDLAYDRAHNDRNAGLSTLDFNSPSYSQASQQYEDAYIKQVNEVIPELFDEMRSNLEEMPGLPRKNFIFTPVTIDENEKRSASFDIVTNVLKGPLWIPYHTWNPEKFHEKNTLRLILNSVENDPRNADKWAKFYNNISHRLQLGPRLSLQSKIQSIGGKIQ